MASTSSPVLGSPVGVPRRGYLSWSSVLAGNAVTGGLILAMLPLGASIGLTMASPFRDSGASMETIGIASIIWFVAMYLFSIAVGGYVAGRLRPLAGDGAVEEVRFRDMMNGLVFWGVGMILSGVITFLAIASTVSTATTAVSNAVGPAVSQAASQLPTPSTDYVADILLRRPAGSQQPGAQQPQSPPASDAEIKGEITRILVAGSAKGQVSEEDRQYLAQLVARQTSLPEAEAKARVDEGLKKFTELKEQVTASAKDMAEKARKATAQGAFWTAILSLVSGLAAMLAARLGGIHRDQGVY